MDDRNDVRSWLGYDRIDLFGLSYGSRAVLAYIRQHPDRVRSATIMGVAPTVFEDASLSLSGGGSCNGIVVRGMREGFGLSSSVPENSHGLYVASYFGDSIYCFYGRTDAWKRSIFGGGLEGPMDVVFRSR